MSPLHNKFIAKNLHTVFSVKFYILVTAAIFFYIGKLSEGAWVEMSLILAGIRSVDKIVYGLLNKGKPGG